MMLKRLIDSVILIDHLNGIDKATDFLSGLSTNETAISVITRSEVLVGVDAESSLRIKRLLDRYQLLVIDGPIADLAAELRRTHGWKLPDAFQAALAMHYKIPLLTRNTKDFDPKKHAFVKIPYEI